MEGIPSRARCREASNARASRYRESRVYFKNLCLWTLITSTAAWCTLFLASSNRSNLRSIMRAL